MPTVTAVITTHKRKSEIVERALKSILSQTYKPIEIFVVDDSPCDFIGRQAVKECVKKYEVQNVKYVAHEKCQGACAARNTGLYMAKGDYIGFLDDDDEWMPEKIEKQLEGFDKEEVALVYCGAINYREKEGKKIPWETKFIKGWVYDRLILQNFIGSTSYPLLKRKCLIDVGGFDPLMQSAQDYDAWLRIARKYEVNYVQESLVLYHIHEGEQITKNPTKKINGLERLIEKNKEYIDKHSEAIWYRYIKLAPFYARNGQKKKALAKWFKAVIRKPFRIKKNLSYLIAILKTKKK